MSVENQALEIINKIARDHGLIPTRRRTGFFYYPPPKGSTSKIAFGYTPHRTEHEGKIGFFTLRIRMLKGKRMTFTKATRFGKRKIAQKHCLEWFKKKYGELPFGWSQADFDRRFGKRGSK